MKASCTIIISHYESIPFLRRCVKQILKYEHPEIEQKIIIADQSGEETRALSTFMIEVNKWTKGVTMANTRPLYSGYGIDWVVRNLDIKTDYICQLHVDAFPIHKNWLHLCISLLEEKKLSFIGQNHFYSRENDTIYPPGPAFFSMSPTFNVARTETYKEMSLEAGFTRFHNRPQSGLTFNNKDWDEWAKHAYQQRGSDDDVVAFKWEGVHRETNKIGLAITGVVGIPGQEPGYGRIIDDIVFHFGSCRESIGVGGKMGARYNEYTRRINEDFSDELVDELLTAARASNNLNMDKIFWDGKKREPSLVSHSVNVRIKELKES